MEQREGEGEAEGDLEGERRPVNEIYNRINEFRPREFTITLEILLNIDI